MIEAFLLKLTKAIGTLRYFIKTVLEMDVQI